MISPRKLRAALLSVVALAALTGCVERRITIGSDPPGAIVTLNDEEIGRTPTTTPFLWYGDYDIVLRLNKNVGTPEKPVIKHYFLHTHKRTHAPWFEWIPIDLFAELSPFEFKDEKVWAFPLPEAPAPSDQELIERAQALKQATTQPEALQSKKKK